MPCKVMIVDDEPLIVEMLADTLEAEGFETVGITCAEEASQRIAEQIDFDAVVTDINLGSSTDGFMLSKLAIERRPEAAIVYMTGAAAPRVPLEGISTAAFVPKPFSPSQLVCVLRRMLAKRQCAQT